MSGNAATTGGGIYNVGDAYLSGATDIRLNTSDESGGGIWSDNALTIHATADWTGLVSDNTPDNCEPSLTLGSTTCS